MKVIVSSLGRFHTFELAQQLLQQQALARLYTGYPRWKIAAELHAHTHTFPWLHVPQMALSRYIPAGAERLNPLATSTFDRWVSANLAEADIFTFMSQFGLYSQRQAQRRGLKTVCIRTSAHIEEQDRILREEYARHGHPYGGINRWTIERELQEYAEAHLIEVCSTYAYDTFRARGFPAEKLSISPLSADLSRFRPVAKTDGVFRVLYVGALSVRKGIRYLLDAVSPLKLPNFECVLTGSVLDEVKPLLRDLPQHVRVTGVLPQAELYRYYSNGSVLVLPSVEDGFGMVMAQAMACGLPVIASTNTGARDLFTDGVEGFIVPIRSPEMLREKICSLYEQPDVQQQMSQAALRRIQAEGGWAGYGQRAMTAYRKLLN